MRPLQSPTLRRAGGVHGNAILSKFEFSDLEAIEHTCHPVDWEAPTHPLAMREPRHGRRLTLAGVVHSNQGPLLLYTAHLEVRTRELGLGVGAREN